MMLHVYLKFLFFQYLCESKYLKILTDGSVDKKEIKKEICDVMEGSEAAFDMRSRRYKQLS